jgi:hypothetical protein
MEADWTAEVGSDLPLIEVDWTGFVDLRHEPNSIGRIAEARSLPRLHDALVLLNGPDSPVFTSKCDVWPLACEDLDPMEFETSPSEALIGCAAYIDVIARDPELFGSFAGHERWVRSATTRLRAIRLSYGRVDLVIRAAQASGRAGFGITLYAAGCGVDTASAQVAWEAILTAAATVTMSEARSPRASSSIG